MVTGLTGLLDFVNPCSLKVNHILGLYSAEAGGQIQSVFSRSWISIQVGGSSLVFFTNAPAVQKYS